MSADIFIDAADVDAYAFDIFATRCHMLILFSYYMLPTFSLLMIFLRAAFDDIAAYCHCHFSLRYHACYALCLRRCFRHAAMPCLLIMPPFSFSCLRCRYAADCHYVRDFRHDTPRCRHAIFARCYAILMMLDAFAAAAPFLRHYFSSLRHGSI